MPLDFFQYQENGSSVKLNKTNQDKSMWPLQIKDQKMFHSEVIAFQDSRNMISLI